ncbi:MAG: acetyltransferase [Kordia sp.]|nr:MAG: acetyltransferase [Kordia sp.]
MKKIISSIIIKFILSANSNDKRLLINSLLSNEFVESKKKFLAKYEISKSFKFNGRHIKFYGDGEIFCGKNSYIGDYSTVQAFNGKKVVIGDNCALSHNVRIYTLTYDSDQNFNTELRKNTLSGDVIIGNGVWIGANVLITPGVRVGDNSIIGANSVVTKDVDSNSIYGGVPAKLIRLKSN